MQLAAGSEPQGSLPFQPSRLAKAARLPREARKRSLDERFEAWLKTYPKMFELFERYALHAIASGHTRYSAKAVVERVRWHVTVERQAGEQFTFNNDYTSRLARMFIEKHPEHRDLFSTRALRS